MSAPTPRKRKAAAPQNLRTVKASVILDVNLHSRVAAAAALRGMTNSALMEDAIRVAVKDIIVMERGKSSGSVKISDRQGEASLITSDDEIAA